MSGSRKWVKPGCGCPPDGRVRAQAPLHENDISDEFWRWFSMLLNEAFANPERMSSFVCRVDHDPQLFVAPRGSKGFNVSERLDAKRFSLKWLDDQKQGDERDGRSWVRTDDNSATNEFGGAVDAQYVLVVFGDLRWPEFHQSFRIGVGWSSTLSREGEGRSLAKDRLKLAKILGIGGLETAKGECVHGL